MRVLRFWCIISESCPTRVSLSAFVQLHAFSLILGSPHPLFYPRLIETMAAKAVDALGGTRNVYTDYLEQPHSTRYDASGPWAAIREKIWTYDEALIKRWRRDMDTTLVFAGLFSATATAFTVEFYHLLQEAPDSQTVLLARISEQTTSFSVSSGYINTTSTASPLGPYIAPFPAVVANGLLFSSLVLGLMVAFWCLVIKQWFSAYLDWYVMPAQPGVHFRMYRYHGLLKWQVPAIIAFVQLLLVLAVCLFLTGLLVQLYILNRTIAIISTVVALLLIVAFITSLILATFYTHCPYKAWSLHSILPAVWRSCPRPRLRRTPESEAESLSPISKISKPPFTTYWEFNDVEDSRGRLDKELIRWVHVTFMDAKSLTSDVRPVLKALGIRFTMLWFKNLDFYPELAPTIADIIADTLWNLRAQTESDSLSTDLVVACLAQPLVDIWLNTRNTGEPERWLAWAGRAADQGMFQHKELRDMAAVILEYTMSIGSQHTWESHGSCVLPLATGGVQPLPLRLQLLSATLKVGLEGNDQENFGREQGVQDAAVTRPDLIRRVLHYLVVHLRDIERHDRDAKSMQPLLQDIIQACIIIEPPENRRIGKSLAGEVISDYSFYKEGQVIRAFSDCLKRNQSRQIRGQTLFHLLTISDAARDYICRKIQTLRRHSKPPKEIEEFKGVFAEALCDAIDSASPSSANLGEGPYRSFRRLCSEHLIKWSNIGAPGMSHNVMQAVVEAWLEGVEFWNRDDEESYQTELRHLKSLRKGPTEDTNLPGDLATWRVQDRGNPRQ